MKILLALLIINFQFVNVYSQEYYTPVDSTIASFPLSESDWVIALTIEQPGLLLDSTGNSIVANPNGTFILTKINNRYSLQRLNRSYVNRVSVLKMDKVINISDENIRLYDKDSILKAEKEWIYPYIYKNDSLNTYAIQYRGSHAPSFRIFFRIKQTMFYKNFENIDITASSEWLPGKNLNYSHNANTFTYRAFMKLIYLLEKNLGIKVLY